MSLERLRSGSERQSRSKKACNRCAKSKMKCDSRQPCQRCKEKSQRCEYTRKGYSDPYAVFQIMESSPPVSTNSKNVLERYGMDQLSESHTHDTRTMNLLSHTSPSTEQDGNTRAVATIDEADFPTSIDDVNAFFMLDGCPNSLDLPLEELRWDSVLTLPGGDDFFSSLSNFPALVTSGESNAASAKAVGQFTEGFQLQQIDGVEAKCVEIRNYLRSFQTGFFDESISNHINREQLVSCIQLYGKYYQPVMPILHLPTFELTKTPAVLLLAMMLVGSCYSENAIPAFTILHCAIHILLYIESSTHERTMQVPPLQVIQANSLLCHVLVCSKNPTAYQFASIYRARTFSMAERANLFSATERINYMFLTEETFDWDLWIDIEMRRRLAYHIFVTDIGYLIFTRCSPQLSPFTFDIDTPCYQSCWTAPTARECLKNLQNLPVQTQVSSALKSIRTAALHDRYLFDSSDFGMHAIIIGLHCILFHAMEESLDHENNIPKPGSSEDPKVIPNLSKLVHRDLLNHDVAKIANDVVTKYGSDAMKRANNALNAWRRNWDARRIRDVYDEGNSAFSHPLNFWLLAKLFIVLHFFRHHALATDDNGQQLNTEFLTFSCPNDGTASGKMRVQVQVVNWLSRIRQRQDVQPLPAESFLSQVINMG